MVKVIKLDVSELEPPQPMRVICQKLEDMPQGTILHVFHRRKPVPLFELLQERYNYRHIEQSENRHDIYIWDKQDTDAQVYVSLNYISSKEAQE